MLSGTKLGKGGEVGECERKQGKGKTKGKWVFKGYNIGRTMEEFMGVSESFLQE
jgi:hypothetical protein